MIKEIWGNLCGMWENNISPARIFGKSLDKLQLPTLSRPPLSPNDPPTRELVDWGMTTFTYSLLAHVRMILRGTLMLSDAGNAQAAVVLCRHLYEWNMQVAYAYMNFKKHSEAKDYLSAWNFFLKISEGNNWIRKHGSKYAPEFPNDEIEFSVHLKEITKAYKEYRALNWGAENVDDDYGYLSEYSHPNGFCLRPYIQIKWPSDVSFIEPQDYQVPGLLHTCVMEWGMVSANILELANEDVVRVQLIEILNGLANEHLRQTQ